ncbi:MULTISPECIES: hypothetical protein [unclassified Bradyrhizobium]|uniref:hypothetical protein n=1 Tax=unclassified Bradyrhizobium TaxID=2631580 RepID=UPI0028E855E1|nr:MULTISPECIES: hypothetical protein [unclassified Bradyrhizobium]
MTYYTSRAQDAAQKIKECQLEVERADAAYRKSGDCGIINRANRKLADAHCEYQRVVGGRANDDR